jgi:hypothetical protein
MATIYFGLESHKKVIAAEGDGEAASAQKVDHNRILFLF